MKLVCRSKRKTAVPLSKHVRRRSVLSPVWCESQGIDRLAGAASGKEADEDAFPTSERQRFYPFAGMGSSKGNKTLARATACSQQARVAYLAPAVSGF